MTLEEILNHFDNVKQDGEQFRANCPACGDTKQHLYITEKDGKILTKCFKNDCKFEEVVQASGLQQKDFFVNQRASRSGTYSISIKSDAKSVPVATREHIYTDIDGHTLGKKIITSMSDGKKRIAWYRFENNQYIKNLNGFKMPLYHLHKLSSADTVIIVEGEKDVETLEKMGYTATTAPNGAGSGWKSEYNKHLTCKDIIILTDNDDVGRIHGTKTAEKLIFDAKSVRLIASESIYNGLKSKGDISDIVQAVGLEDAKKLLEIAIENTPEYIPAPEPDAKTERIGQAMLDIYDGQRKKPALTIELLEDYLELKHIQAKYNEITHDIEYDIKNSKYRNESKEHIKENISALLYNDLFQIYKKCTTTKIAEFLNVIATRNKYNPVIDLISSVEWDGKNRLEDIYKMLGIDASDTLSRVLLKKWFMQCICGLHNNLQNPYSLDIVLVFQGEQGIGKTRLLEHLALSSRFFKEGATVDPRDKDSKIQASSKWICELGEIGSTMKKDLDSLKAFLTSSTDEYRLPYGKTALQYPRLTSFCGTTNDQQFLIDETGNRRFATVPIKSGVYIDYNTQVKPFDALQFWAEITHIVDDAIQSGESYASCFRLNREELAQLNARNKEFEKPLKGEVEVLDVLAEQSTEKPDYKVEYRYMTTTEFREHNDSLKRYTAVEIGKVLEKHGYKQVSVKMNGNSRKKRKLPYRYYAKFANIV
ncbi:MAG: toprim domain-containing protein [Oscillospiraceae bacterium]|nr:toprim domain-containing protein [Oscillospiraceae bacterium]